MLAQKTVKSRQTANISPTSSHRYLLKLENNGIIERLGIADNPTIYVFTDRKDSLDNKPEYSDEVLSLISDLRESDSSIKDRRIGDMLYNCLDRGFISILDYQNIEEQKKWKTDMVFAEQLGLVKCVDKTTYSICTQIDRSNASLPEAQKDILTAMYDFFGEDAFSAEMVIAKLDTGTTAIKGCLHQFTWLKLLEREKNDNIYVYHLNVNPTDNPECFTAA